MGVRKLAVGLGLWLALAGAAQAEDFTFTVPVRIANVPPAIVLVAVSCYVANRNPTPGRAPLGIFGNGHAFVPMSGGAYSGDVTVAVNANPRENAGFADHYGCYIMHLGEALRADGTGDVHNPNIPPFIPLDPAAPYVVTTGELPLR